MSLQDFITPDEIIKYRSSDTVEYQGSYYDSIITNKRLIWYKQSGLVFKKDNFVCEFLENIKSLKFEEQGIISKKGVIKIAMIDRNLAFSGGLSSMRALFNHIQSLILPEKSEKSVQIIKEPVYVHEKIFERPILEKERKMYACKICENAYTSKTKALSCEKSHKKKRQLQKKKGKGKKQSKRKR